MLEVSISKDHAQLPLFFFTQMWIVDKLEDDPWQKLVSILIYLFCVISYFMKTFKIVLQGFLFMYSVLLLHTEQLIPDLTMLQKLISALSLPINIAELFFTWLNANMHTNSRFNKNLIILHTGIFESAL